ncbi:MAG: hypothetical protein ACTSWL_09355 [Promethearchaeota archaeon]
MIQKPLHTHKLLFEEIFSSKGRAIILKILSIHKEMNISHIVKMSKLNYTSVKAHLDYFSQINFIQKKEFGRIKIYRYKEENIMAKSLQNLIILWEKQ